MENWKPIVGYKGYYEINEFGIIKSLDRYVVPKGGYPPYLLKEKYMNPILNTYGYFGTMLRKDGINKNITVHKEVAKAFVKNKNKDINIQVNHIDGNKENNHFSNLEWVSPKENIRHAISLGLRKNCIHRGRLTRKQVLKIRKSEKGSTALAKEYGLTYQNIRFILTGKTYRKFK